ncbi:YihY/virulence factor BrkB family protein [Haloarculaceae archaeon H-GB2-1]|nr:YihY/virulence factor BrkB family protein [Haloarculaceae archaeon H-GB2-1]
MSHDGPDRTVFATVRDVVSLAREHHLGFMAASIAYSAFLSLLPLLLLLVLLATVVAGQQTVQAIVGVTERYLSPAGQDLVRRSVTQSAQRVEFSVISVAVLVWGTLRVFRGLDIAFDTLYQPAREDGLLGQLRNGLVVLVAILLATIAMAVAGGVLALLPWAPSSTALNVAALLVGLGIAFLPIFYVFPEVDVSLREVLPGTAVAALGWAALQGLFQLYVNLTSAGELYGVLGGVVLLITWLYFGSLVVLAGAAVNVVVGGHDDRLADGRRGPTESWQPGIHTAGSPTVAMRQHNSWSTSDAARIIQRRPEFSDGHDVEPGDGTAEDEYRSESPDSDEDVPIPEGTVRTQRTFRKRSKPNAERSSWTARRYSGVRKGRSSSWHPNPTRTTPSAITVLTAGTSSR